MMVMFIYKQCLTNNMDRKEYMKKYRETHRDKFNEYSKKYVRTNGDKVKRSHEKWYFNWKMRMIKKLGGKCVHCGFKDIRALQFDHINGDGYKEKRTWSKNNTR